MFSITESLRSGAVTLAAAGLNACATAPVDPAELEARLRGQLVADPRA